MSAARRNMDDFTLLGTGKSLDQGQGMNLIDLAIPNPSRASHVGIIGTSGSGKTRLAENIIEQDIRAGRSVVVIDPKIDQDLASKIVQVAVACGREEDLMFINTVFPGESVLINPMSHYFVFEELCEHCISGIKEGNEPFFRNIAKEVVSAAITALGILSRAKKEPRLHLSLQTIKDQMSIDDLNLLAQQLTGLTGKEAENAAKDITRITATGEEYFNKVISSLRVTMMELTTGNIGEIIGKTDENRFLTRLEEGKSVILVCQLGTQIVHDAAFTLGKIVISMIQTFIGRVVSSSRRKVSPPMCIHIDEAASVLHAEMETFFAQSRSADCWITIYAQSMNQFNAKLGKDLALSILSNINTKIFLRVPDSESADYVAKHFGTVQKLSPVIAPGGQITTREVEEDVVKGFDVLSLKAREFYMLTYSTKTSKGRFKGRTGDTSPSWIEIVYPDAPSY